MGKLTIKEEVAVPQTPTSGNRSLYPKSDGWYELDDQGTETKVFSSTVYGSNFLFAEDQFQDTNTTTTYKTYAGINYPSGLATNGNKYEITISATTRYSALGRNHIARVAIDGVTLREEIQVEHKDSGADIRVPISYSYIIDGSELNLAGGFIDFDYKAQNNGDTAYVYSTTLTFKRVS